MSSVRYPLEPLAAALGCSLSGLGRRLGVSGSQWKQYRDEGVSEKVADRLAVKAGLTPYELWPSMLDAAIDAATQRCRECGEPFIPSRPWNVYCQAACQQRASGRVRMRRRRQRPEVRERDRAYKRAYYAENAEYLRRQNREYHQRRKQVA